MDQSGMDEKKNNYILSFIENEEFDYAIVMFLQENSK